MTAAVPPALSAILITPDAFDRLQRTIAALRTQTVSDQIELVLVAPELPARPLAEGTLACFHGHQVVLMPNTDFTSAAAWAAGVRAAQAPIVVFCEDHSYPEPSWAEHLLAAHRGPWAVVGPAVRNGNPISLASWTDFFIGYGEWAYPSHSAERQHLPGHNSSYKRDILLAYGDQLAHILEAETLLHWDLHRQGHRLYLQAEAVTRHINFTNPRTLLRLRWWQGYHFGAMRTVSWPWRRRLPWLFGSLLIPAIRLRRIYREIRRPGRFQGSVLGLLAVIGLMMLCDGIGQMAGCAFGPGNIYPYLSSFELSAEIRANQPAV